MKLSHLKYIAPAILLFGGAQQTFAAGTVQGTTIGNTATVNYQVGGVNQTAASGTANFVVDRRINVTVARLDAAYVDVAPGSTAQVLKFSVTNNTNGLQDFRLIGANQTTGTTDAFGGTDAFDTTGVQVFVDVNNNGTYEAGTDIATFIDELAADASKTVFVVSSVPIGQVNNDTAGITLTAVSANSGAAGTLGVDATQTAGADTAGVDTVFGDIAGAATGDIAKDGKHSAADAYRVRSAALAVTKSATVISDPFNGAVTPKAIPGAVIEYCIDVNNTGGVAAGSVVMTDAIPANATYVAGSIRTAVTGALAGCTSGTGVAEDDDNTGVDETDPDGADFGVTTANTVTVRIGGAGIAAAARAKMLFRATVN